MTVARGKYYAQTYTMDYISGVHLLEILGDKVADSDGLAEKRVQA